MNPTAFHGSYLADDVEFLVKPIDVPLTELEDKERLIQQQKRHYSELLSPEYRPSSAYLNVFQAALKANRHTMARHALTLAAHIAKQDKPVLVSLLRAGTPVGVLLRRILKTVFGKTVPHYSISIIRDRGIDDNALKTILSRHGATGDNIVFIDGWTGKGVITRELKRWVAQFNQENQTQINSDLHVLADISGSAAVSATLEDFLMPSALLNATISGLVSRSVLNSDYIGTDDYHGCKYYPEWQADDLSLWFIDNIMAAVASVLTDIDLSQLAISSESARVQQHARAQAFIAEMMASYQLTHSNFLKPSLGEAIRVLLRRVPLKILLQDINNPEIQAFLVLAEEKGVAIEERPDMPYKAAGIIANVAN